MTRANDTCTQWSAMGAQRHRCSQRGYACPEIQDDLARRVYEKVEGLREQRGYEAWQVVLCGVDNSSTAFAMAVIRRCPSDERYSFCSGRKGGECEHCGGTGEGMGTLDSYAYTHDSRPIMWVMVDDDICEGRALRTLSPFQDVHWFGIHNYLMEATEGYGFEHEWCHDMTFHWWGQTDMTGAIDAPPVYRTSTGYDMFESEDEDEEQDDDC